MERLNSRSFPSSPSPAPAPSNSEQRSTFGVIELRTWRDLRELRELPKMSDTSLRRFFTYLKTHNVDSATIERLTDLCVLFRKDKSGATLIAELGRDQSQPVSIEGPADFHRFDLLADKSPDFLRNFYDFLVERQGDGDACCSLVISKGEIAPLLARFELVRTRNTFPLNASGERTGRDRGDAKRSAPVTISTYADLRKFTWLKHAKNSDLKSFYEFLLVKKNIGLGSYSFELTQAEFSQFFKAFQSGQRDASKRANLLLPTPREADKSNSDVSAQRINVPSMELSPLLRLALTGNVPAVIKALNQGADPLYTISFATGTKRLDSNGQLQDVARQLIRAADAFLAGGPGDVDSTRADKFINEGLLVAFPGLANPTYEPGTYGLDLIGIAVEYFRRGHREMLLEIMKWAEKNDYREKLAERLYPHSPYVIELFTKGVFKKDPEVINLLLKSASFLSDVYERDTPELMNAILTWADDYECLGELGGVVNQRSSSGALPLQIALNHNDPEAVWLMLKAGVNLHALILSEPNNYLVGQPLLIYLASALSVDGVWDDSSGEALRAPFSYNERFSLKMIAKTMVTNLLRDDRTHHIDGSDTIERFFDFIKSGAMESFESDFISFGMEELRRLSLPALPNLLSFLIRSEDDFRKRTSQIGRSLYWNEALIPALAATLAKFQIKGYGISDLVRILLAKPLIATAGKKLQLLRHMMILDALFEIIPPSKIRDTNFNHFPNEVTKLASELRYKAVASIHQNCNSEDEVDTVFRAWRLSCFLGHGREVYKFLEDVSREDVINSIVSKFSLDDIREFTDHTMVHCLKSYSPYWMIALERQHNMLIA